MIATFDLFESIRWVSEFTVTDDHLKLLRHAYAIWGDCEFGAPVNDPKRPCGDSYFTRSIA
jgi:hypothetical protein